MKAKIIGVHGKMRSGKSIVCRTLPDVIRDIVGQDCHVHYCSMSTMIKKNVAQMTGIKRTESNMWVAGQYDTCDTEVDFSESAKNTMAEGTFNMTIGTVLQKYGGAMRDTFGFRILIDLAIMSAPSETTHIVIDGVRYLSDAQILEDEGGSVIRVVRPDTTTPDSRSKSHASETELDDYAGFAYTYNNVKCADKQLAALNCKAALLNAPEIRDILGC